MNLNENGNKKDPETAVWNKRVRGIVGKEITPELHSILAKLLERCDQERSQSAGIPGHPARFLPMRSRQGLLATGMRGY